MPKAQVQLALRVSAGVLRSTPTRKQLRSPNQMALLFGMNEVELKPHAAKAVKDFYEERCVDIKVLETTALLEHEKPWQLPSEFSDESIEPEECFYNREAWTRNLVFGFDDEGIKKALEANPRLPWLLGPVLVWRQFTKETGEHAEAMDASLTLEDVNVITNMINTRMQENHQASLCFLMHSAGR